MLKFKLLFFLLAMTFGNWMPVGAQSYESDLAVQKMSDAIDRFNRSNKSDADLIVFFNSLKSADTEYGSYVTDPNTCFEIYKVFAQLQNTFQQKSTASVNINNLNSAWTALGYVGYVSDAAFIGGKYLGRAADGGHTQALNIVRNMGMTGVTTVPSARQGGVTTTETCSMCGGKGWIPGFKTPTYGSMSRYWCEECHEEVGASHSHDKCPSCSGVGKRTRLK